MTYEIKDSGKRAEFAGGMMRDTEDGKADLTNLIRFFPLGERYALHMTKGRKKYPDPEPGIPNWTLASGREELGRFKRSATRHFFQWLNGETDEDHAAAVVFNINAHIYLEEKLNADV